MAEQGAQDLYLDGTFLPLSQGRVSVEDRGFTLADGVYEVIRFRADRFLWLSDHLDRLEHSLLAVDMPHPTEQRSLRSILPELVRRSGLAEGYIYLQITRGPAPRDFVIPGDARPTVAAWAVPFRARTWEEVRQGCTAVTVADSRWARCDIMSLMLLPAVLAKSRAAASGAGEIIWLGPDGSVREGGSSNIFAVWDRTLLTHPVGHHILNGVTRLRVLELAGAQGFSVQEHIFTQEQLLCADEIFLTSTLRDVLPITALDGRPVGSGQPGAVTLAVARAVREAVAAELTVGGQN